jgi:hypothetical protein
LFRMDGVVKCKMNHCIHSMTTLVIATFIRHSPLFLRRTSLS